MIARATLAVAALLALGSSARGDTVNFDMSGKIYTKYMYQNDNTQGCLSISNPFWVDNIGGHNGACTEFELTIKARVGPRVSAGVRLQSRWGALWQDWWENGDLKRGVADTSGESLGMNHAQYIKLRGAFVRMAPPIPTVKWITVGATDYSMWNEWTIGKARYIDRDNGSGVFVEGEALPDKMLSYTTGAMALPKLWAGPGWQTGLKDSDPLAYLYGTDWAFAAKLESRPNDSLRLRLIGTMVRDWEADRYSPFLTGAPDARRGADHSVALATRFRGLNATLDGVYTPPEKDWLQVSGLLAFSSNYVNPNYATNLVRNGQGFSPVVFKTDCPTSGCTPQDLAAGLGNSVPANALAGTLLFEVFDPFKNGFSAKLQLFDIGSEYNAIMGARREADVLITDGIIAGGFTRGGQLPTLNIANEFQDWDEPWYESCIGWRGATAILEYVKGPLRSTIEGTYIGYNTNTGVDQFGVPVQRDVKNQYPDFLYTNGFTDTTAFTADSDYANVYDRGKDPRSVYAQFQDRHTFIGVLTAQYLVPGFKGTPTLNVKAKYVNDYDGRRQDILNDDYRGKNYLGLASISLQPTNELKTTLGYEFSYWQESARDGSEQAGFYGVNTRRHTFHAGLSYAFGGALFTYALEYFHKDLLRDPRAYYNMVWNVWRAKATFEAGW
jgi:hypothetical protein